MQTRTFFDLEIFSQWFGDRVLVAVINVLLALIIALRGGEIVDLILLFYATYLCAAWIPFTAYLLDYFDVYSFSANSVKLALLTGSTSAIASLLLILVRAELVIFDSDRLTVAIIGLSMATIGLVVTEIAEKLLLSIAKKEISS